MSLSGVPIPTKRNIYSQYERNLLKELVMVHKIIVENKQTDKITVQNKNRVWEEITDDFNAQSGIMERSVESLRKCWENMKCTAKKEVEIIVPDHISDNSKIIPWTKRKLTVNGSIPSVKRTRTEVLETSVDFERIEHDEKMAYFKFKTEQKKLVTEQKLSAYRAKQNYYEEMLKTIKRE